MIPRYDPVRADAWCRDDLARALTRVFERGAFICGEENDALERELSTRLDDRHVVAVGSGTDALALALAARKHRLQEEVGVSPDVVVTSAFSFTATASAICRAGLRPRFVDIDGDTMLLDFSQVEMEADVLCVVPVHLYGYVADPPDAAMPMIEDACQALGATASDSRPAGALSLSAALSFFPSKPLGCYGDGGAVVCRDALDAQLVRRLARHGHRDPYCADVVGFNSRLDELQAAVLRVKLPGMDTARKLRSEIAARYDEAFADLRWVLRPPRAPGHGWHCYVLRVDATLRERVVQKLRDGGVDAVVQYPVPLHRMPAFAQHERVGDLLNAESAAAEVVGLPIWAGMTSTDVGAVVDAVRRIEV